MTNLADADRVFFLLLIAVCLLGSCLVWALWEMEQSRERRAQQRLRQSRPQLTWRR
jgi:hypothetical protein